MRARAPLAAQLVMAAGAARPRSAFEWRYLGDPILHQPTRDVTEAEMPFVVTQLLPEMLRLHGRAWTPGVGLAANQIGIDLRVTIARVGSLDAHGQKQPGEWLEMINPRITERSPKMFTHTQEGCLSVPNVRTSMRRHLWVVVAWQDRLWVPQQRKFTGFDALIMQHEADHLDGRTIMDGQSRQQKRAAARAVAEYLERQR